jgi:ABC-type polysaccharide/polyol phosphate transport system ATPase subunit
MTDSVIRVESLGKRYRVGERERYLALRDVIARALQTPARLLSRRNGSNHHAPEHIWALKDLSLEIHEGEVVGIIGRNGAGKSTLLKILARITRPTEGSAEIRGRVGSLLEVGTGFHPELTGRENVYLSGAILGMKKAEIDRKFDEIVAFAEVERFLDTPLKHYSSGMQMRLAFAVAAHLEPEILLVDEVLAVGDLEFQKRCLGKMHEVSQTGRTIVFVSHQMNQIRRLCAKAYWLDAGLLRREGPAKEVVNEYEAAALNVEADELQQTPGPIGFRRWLIEGIESNQLDLDESPDRVALKFRTFVKHEIRNGILFIALRSSDNHILWSAMHHDLHLRPGPVDLVYSFETLPLNPGIYLWEIRVFDGHHWFEHLQVPELSIVSKTDSNVYGHLKGALNLGVTLDLLEQVECEVGKS